MNKKEARTYIKNKLLSIDKTRLSKASYEFIDFILNHKEYKKNENILLYCNIKNEIPSSDLIIQILQSNKKIFLPKIIDDTTMEFYQLKDIGDLKKAAFNILEPKQENIFNKKQALVIIPVLAIYKNYRLGYGKGYYDRYLSRANSFYTIAVGLLEQNIDDLEIEQTDVMMSEVKLF